MKKKIDKNVFDAMNHKKALSNLKQEGTTKPQPQKTPASTTHRSITRGTGK